MIVIKLILIMAFVLVFIQDYKARKVYWFLFPIIGFIGVLLFYKNSNITWFLASIKMNVLFLSVMLLGIYLYTRFKLKTHFFKTIGLGDLLLFIAIAVSFSTVSFIVLFVSALIFSLILHTIIFKSQKTLSVPLAGYMSLFFLMSYLFYWTGFVDNVYSF